MANEQVELEEVYDLRLKREAVRVIDTDGSPKTWYVCEVSGDAIEDYLESGKDNADASMDKETGRVTIHIKSYKGMYSELLTRTLKDDAGAPIPADKVKALPNAVQKKLYAKAQALNGLNKEAVQDIKNA